MRTRGDGLLVGSIHGEPHTRAAGYRRMLLGTLPAMGSAHGLYERLGFLEVPAYRFNPAEGARFMALSLESRP